MKYSMFFAVERLVSLMAPTGVMSAEVKIPPYSATGGVEVFVRKNAVISLPTIKFSSSYWE